MLKYNPKIISNIAQWIERASYKGMVVGSNPTIEHNAPKQLGAFYMFTPSDLMEAKSALCNFHRLCPDPIQHRYNQVPSPSHNHFHLHPCIYGTSDNPILSDFLYTTGQTCVAVSPYGFQNHTYCIRYAAPSWYIVFSPAVFLWFHIFPV